MKPKTAGRVGGAILQTGQLARPETANTGLVTGACILTLNGSVPVEDLCIGDRVITRECGAVPVTKIEVVSRVAPMVYIIAGSIGHSRSDRDALVSCEQSLLVRDWRAPALFGQREAMVQAGQLVDGEFVRSLGQLAVTLYRLHCARPHIVYADGLELGTTGMQIDGIARRAA